MRACLSVPSGGCGDAGQGLPLNWDNAPADLIFGDLSFDADLEQVAPPTLGWRRLSRLCFRVCVFQCSFFVVTLRLMETW